MRFFLWSLVLTVCLSGSFFQSSPAQANEQCGLLVMAHGGSAAWDAAVQEAVAPLHDYLPVSIAFGMADPASLQESMTALDEQGVTCVAVVRLFMSAQSFLHQTEYLLGVRPDPPARFILHHGHGHHGSDKQETPSPIQTDIDIVLSRQGLLDAPEIGAILAKRARALSHTPEEEAVLLIAHGPGDDAENEQWVRKLDALADSIRAEAAFPVVQAATLREDWAEKRAEAEQRIRGFVGEQTDAGRRVLVIPFRLFGFGPYEEVLAGLTYVADGQGLLPDRIITDWIWHQTMDIITTSGWPDPVAVYSN